MNFYPLRKNNFSYICLKFNIAINPWRTLYLVYYMNMAKSAVTCDE